MSEHEITDTNDRELYFAKQGNLEKIFSKLSAAERSEFDKRLRITISACRERNSLVRQRNHLLELETKQENKWANSYLIFLAACFLLIPVLYFYDPTPLQQAVFGLIVGATFIYQGLVRKIEKSANWVVEKKLELEIARLDREKDQFGLLEHLSNVCGSDLAEGTQDSTLKEWLTFSRDKASLSLKYEILKTMHLID